MGEPDKTLFARFQPLSMTLEVVCRGNQVGEN